MSKAVTVNTMFRSILVQAYSNIYIKMPQECWSLYASIYMSIIIYLRRIIWVVSTDYNWREPERTHHRSLLKSRLLRQTVLSFVFTSLVATTIGADNLLGDGARYVAGQGSTPRTVWPDFSDAVPAVADSENEANDVAEQSSAATPSGTEYPQQPLSFIAPASGVVVQDMALDSTGVTSDKGIIIRGAAGQDIRFPRR